MSIQKDDLLTVGVDLPDSYNHWEKTGSTKLADWPEEVAMTFKFDFTNVPLERVFELAVGALVIDRRPALKKEGFEFYKLNPVVEIKVAELKNRGPAVPKNLASHLIASLSTGTTRVELSKLTKEQIEEVRQEFEELQKSLAS